MHPENYLGDGVLADMLERCGATIPVSLHATGLSLGSADGVDDGHLAAIAALADRIQPGLISDHLSWSAAGGVHLPDLLPLPYTREAQDIFVRNLDRVQTALGRAILIENPSVYLAFADSEMREGEFLAGLARRKRLRPAAGHQQCRGLGGQSWRGPLRRLLRMLDDLPAAAIGEIHLAGHAVLQARRRRPGPYRRSRLARRR